MYLRGTVRFEAGSRFKHTPARIEFSYENLVNAIAEAVDKQESEKTDSVTDKRSTAYDIQKKDYAKTMEEFIALAKKLMEEDPANNQKQIEKIIEKYIGRGKRVTDLSEDSTDIIELINEDLKAL